MENSNKYQSAYPLCDINISPSQSLTELCHIMNFYGSDKGNGWHNYTLYYYELFKNIRNYPIRLFELGLGTNNVNIPSNMGPNGKPGASLRGWKHFFPNASIFGADIDQNILFEEDRITTFYCDQGSPASIRNMWSDPKLQENMDIIVEDGLHEFSYNVCFFENSVHKLVVGGIFIIEDIEYNKLYLWENKISEWQSKMPNMNFRIFQIDCANNTLDNMLIIIQKMY